MNQELFLKTILADHEQTFGEVSLDKKKIYAFVDGLLEFLFPQQGQGLELSHLEEAWRRIEGQLRQMMGEMKCCDYSFGQGEDMEHFFEEVAEIYALLNMDADTMLACDPAAQTRAEIILAYPGFYAIAVYRISHLFYRKGAKLLARIISEYAHSKTGIDIHPGARIGKHFLIDHGTGVVIGETAVIGDRVKIYQGVTLGALVVSKQWKGEKRHPTIEDDVTIYSGASILGGNTVVGRHSVIGGNVWLIHSVAPHSMVYNKSQSDIKTKATSAVIDFVI